MTRYLVFLVCLGLSILSIPPAKSQTYPLVETMFSVPGGTDLSRFAIDRFGTMFAVVTKAYGRPDEMNYLLFRKRGAADWTISNMDQLFSSPSYYPHGVSGVTVSTLDDVMYAAQNQYFCASFNLGVDFHCWQQEKLWAPEVLPPQRGRASLLTYGNGNFRSTDNGATFAAIPAAENFTVMAATFTDANTIYGGGLYGDVWKSVDGGATWVLVRPFSAGSFTGALYDYESAIRSIVVSPEDPNRVFVSMHEGIVASSDGGKSWTKVLSPVSAGQIVPWSEGALGLDSGGRYLVYYTKLTLYYSTDDGSTWKSVPHSFSYFNRKIPHDPVRPGVFYAANAGTFYTITIAPSVPNYQGLWWNANESGWGVNFSHQGDIVFATWFTYDGQGKPWWLIAQLDKSANGVYAGPVSTVAGPLFNSTPFGPPPVETEVGTMTATFADASHATIAYSVNGTSQTKAIVPQAFGTLPTCTWGAQPNLALATNYTDLWWNAQESGWGVNFTHQGDTIFATWFTYDGQGKPWWLIAVLSKGAGSAYSGPVSTVAGPLFNSMPFGPPPVETEIGTATVTFANGNSATFSYTVNGTAQTKAITRQVFVAPGTVCQ